MSGYQAAEEYVLSFADYERTPRQAVVFDLKRVDELLRRLGEPHKAAKSVHIAGTKGKGSTSAMIASVLTAAGYRTGFYSSPHLLTMRERIRLDGKPIGEEDWVRLVEHLKPHVEAMDASDTWGGITTFEVLTALGFSYFKEKNVDFQVLETGMGGRLDATNVVEPEVCVITSISLDHTHVLGNTLPQVAAEKAGIIKAGIPVITAPQFPEVAAVIEEKCREKGADLVRVGKEVTWKRNSFDLSGQSFRVQGMGGEYDLTISLLGEYQLENAAVAVAALEALAGKGISIPPRSMVEGMARVQWPGRIQILQRQPLLVVDGAHNPYAVRKVGEALKEYLEYEQAIVILGVTSDKDIAGIVTEVTSFADTVIVTRTRHPKSASISTLVDEFSRQGRTVQAVEEVAPAVDAALAMAGPRDMVCATGSLFVVAEVLEHCGKGLSVDSVCS